MQPGPDEREPNAGLVLATQLAIVVGLLAYWQWGPLDELMWSRPGKVASRVAALWAGVEGLPPLWRQILDTLIATFVGLAVGVAAGVVLGLVLSELTLLRLTFAPFLGAINAVPRVAWVPVITLLFGFGFLTKIIMSGLIVFLVVFFNVLDAATNAPTALIDGVRALGGRRFARMRDVRFWSAISAMAAALPSAIAFALVGVVFAESLNAESGLGALMFNAMQQGRSDDLVVSALTLGLIGLVLVGASRSLERLLLRRVGIAAMRRAEDAA